MFHPWCALVPQKALVHAKRRLALAPECRQALATAMLRDTVSALLATPDVVRTFVLWDERSDRDVLPSTEALIHVVTTGYDLNKALDLGAGHARRAVPGCHVVVVPSDLPALDPAELHRFLLHAGRYRGAFLADAGSTGTTLLTATSGTALSPAYGPGSSDSHRASGAHEVTDPDLQTLRRDVDDLIALAQAVQLGCGTHTSACTARTTTGLEATG